MKVYRVYDSLGNFMAGYGTYRDALSHKVVFGNLKWEIREEETGRPVLRKSPRF